MICNEDYETMPREALEVLQLKRLKQIVHKVYNSLVFLQKIISLGMCNAR
jgi:phenylacetate-CoA ligase